MSKKWANTIGIVIVVGIVGALIGANIYDIFVQFGPEPIPTDTLATANSTDSLPEPDPIPQPRDTSDLEREANSIELEMSDEMKYWLREWIPELGKGWRAHPKLYGYRRLSDSVAVVGVHDFSWDGTQNVLLTFKHDSIFIGKITIFNEVSNLTGRYSDWENDSTFVLQDSSYAYEGSPEPEPKYLGKW